MKYNWSIIWHEKQLREIENDIESGNISHAYLLAGPNSVGKHTVAKKLAGILQCENDFCHTCPTCIQVQKGCHLDTVELLDDKESIKIEDVRKLIERANMTSQSKYKIFLIQSIERMTTEAANSFLKILEEPPVGTVFILTTNTLRGILPTVVSRTRVIKFGSVSVSFLEKTLKELYPDFDEETIRNVSLLSLGKTGKAVHLMENPDALAVTMKAYHDIQNLLDHKNIVDRFGYVEEISDDFSQAETFLNVLSHVLRSRMIEGTESERHISALQKVDEAGVLLKKNINSKLVLENLMLFL